MPVSKVDISQLSSQLHTSADDASLITVPIVHSLALEPFPAAFKAPTLRTEPQGYLQAVLQKSRLGCNWSVNYCTLQQTVPPKTEAAYWKINKRSAFVCMREKKTCSWQEQPATDSGCGVISNPITLQDYVSDYESMGVMGGPVHDSTQAGNFLLGTPFPRGLASLSAPVCRNPSLSLYLCREICTKPK